MRWICRIALLLSCLIVAQSAHTQYYNTFDKYLNANKHTGLYGGAYMFEIEANRELNFIRNPYGTFNIVTESNFVVSDPANGDLLFYSLCYEQPDSNRYFKTQLYNSRHEPIDNAEFHFKRSIAEIMHFTLVAPSFDDDYLFYIFYYENTDEDGTVYNLCYAILDMRANNGNGAIISRNNVLQRDVRKQFQRGVIPGNNCNMWIVLLDEQNKLFLSYQLKGTTLDTLPISTPINLRSDLEQADNPVFKIAPDRQTLFMSSTVTNRNANSGSVYEQDFFTWKFNLSDGTVHSPLRIKTSIGSLYVPFTNYEFLDHNIIYLSLNNLGKFESRAYIIDISNYDEQYILDNIKQLNNTIPDNRFVEYKKYKNELYTLSPKVRYQVPPDPTILTAHGDIFFQSFSEILSDQEATPSDFVEEDFVPYLVNEPVYLNNNFLSQEIIYPLPYQSQFTNGVHVSNHCFDTPKEIPLTALRTSTTYTWDDGSSDATRIVTKPGVYWVSYPHECVVLVDSFYVKDVYQDIAIQNLDTLVCLQHFPLEIQYPNLVDSILFNQQNIASNTIAIEDAGNYYLELYQSGCKSEAQITVAKETCPCDIFKPNAFTPNGDGLNDYFKPITLNGCVPLNYTLKIYNRYGNMMYASYSDNNLGWDGTSYGKDLPAGVYYFIFQFTDSYTGKDFFYKGDVTLIR